MSATRLSALVSVFVVATACKLGNLPAGSPDASGAGGAGGTTGGAGGTVAGTGGTTGGAGGTTGGAGGAPITGAGGTTGGAGGMTTGMGGAGGTTGGAGGMTTGMGGAGGGSTCNKGATCTPTTGADPCGVYGIDCSSGAPACIRTGSVAPGTTCSGGVCSPGGDCLPCTNGADCVAAGDPCKVGTLSCSGGQPSCTPTATSRPDGDSCGPNRVCHTGVCGACLANADCMPPAGACVGGVTDCSTGVRICQPTQALPPGTGCGTGLVCDGAGTCSACSPNSACTPANLCHAGTQVCSSGTPSCADTSTPLPDNVFCSTGMLCSAGTCVGAGNWITRGEDARTMTGGWVYSIQSGGATATPFTSTTVVFVPSPGGLTGDALAVSGTIPPQIPAQNVYPVAGLGWDFQGDGTSIDGGARGAGIQFYAKSPVAQALQVEVGDIWTDPSYPNCTTRAASDVVNACFDFPEAICNLQPGTWTLCRFFWSDFKRPDFGNAGAFLPVDENGITRVQIAPPLTPAGAAPRSFQYAVDDASFIPTGTALPACSSPLMIDDMEDGDGGACPSYSGGWYVLKSAGAGPTNPLPNSVITATPIPNGGRQGSLEAMRFTGSALPPAPEYAIIGLAVNGAGPIDASGHGGLLFWARSGAGVQRVRVNVVTFASLGSDGGGGCIDMGPGLGCNDHWGAFVDLTTDWRQYAINFSTGLAQEGWGQPVIKDLAQLEGFEFQYQRDPVLSPNNPSSFEYWLDDVQFF
jgi:hypothetical protein